MNEYQAKALSASGEVLKERSIFTDIDDVARAICKNWAESHGAVGWSMIGPLGTTDQAFRSGLVK
jgi:hypothetical protein